MKTRNAFTGLTICVLSGTIPIMVNMHQVSAQNRVDCRELVAGTYLTITNAGDFGSFRSLITFTKDGNFFATDSNQSGDPIIPPFGDTRGSWKCTSHNEITGTSLTFSYPTATSSGTVDRGDFSATFNPRNGTVQGTATLRSYPLNANPLNDFAPVAGTFTFTAQRVNPGE